MEEPRTRTTYFDVAAESKKYRSIDVILEIHKDVVLVDVSKLPASSSVGVSDGVVSVGDGEERLGVIDGELRREKRIGREEIECQLSDSKRRARRKRRKERTDFDEVQSLENSENLDLTISPSSSIGMEVAESVIRAKGRREEREGERGWTRRKSVSAFPSISVPLRNPTHS